MASKTVNNNLDVVCGYVSVSALGFPELLLNRDDGFFYIGTAMSIMDVSIAFSPSIMVGAILQKQPLTSLLELADSRIPAVHESKARFS